MKLSCEGSGRKSAGCQMVCVSFRIGRMLLARTPLSDTLLTSSSFCLVML